MSCQPTAGENPAAPKTAEKLARTYLRLASLEVKSSLWTRCSAASLRFNSPSSSVHRSLAVAAL